MKYMIKSLSDKITAAIVYLILAELVVAMFLALPYWKSKIHLKKGGRAHA